jgi:uncharacterized protein YbaR (Trm112 family)
MPVQSPHSSGVPMRKDLMDKLACPLCKGDLELHVKREEKDLVLEGSIECKRCKVTYPIEDGIPNLLPPDER